MDSLTTLCVLLFSAMLIVLLAFAVFAIGFLVGYKSENQRILKRKQQRENMEIIESEKEKKAKKEWKNFLEYDGSAPAGRE